MMTDFQYRSIISIAKNEKTVDDVVEALEELLEDDRKSEKASKKDRQPEK